MLTRRILNAPSFRRLCKSTQNATVAAPSDLRDPCCDPDNPIVVDRAAVTEAAYGIREGIDRTLCRYSRQLSRLTGVEVYLKMEQTQSTGSFKERGARWALMNLTPEEKKRGVFAASAGNHAQALCIHGRELGIPVTVVMPRHAPIKKIAQCKELGGNIIVQGKDISESRLVALGKSFEEGGKYINGYDHEHIIAGAGTVGLEVLEQVPDAAAVLVSVGGGGLLAGVATAAKGKGVAASKIDVIGVEAESCPSFTRSLEAGKPIFTPANPTLADGLAVPLVGVNAFATAKDRIDEMVLVNEKQIGLAILRLVEMEKTVVEGAGAAGIGALLSGQLNKYRGKKVVAILSGGNIDTTQLGRVMERGMAWDNRLVRFKVVVSDRPGGIAELTELIAKCGASIKDMFLERSWNRQDVFTVRVKLIAETKDCEHAQQLEHTIKTRYGEADCHFNLFPYEKPSKSL